MEPPDPLTRLAARREAIGPLLRRAVGEFLERNALALRGLRLEPRQEVGRGKVGKREQHVGEVALGIDDQRGDAVDRRLLDEADEQPCLAAAGHADADGMRGKPLGIHEHGFARGRPPVGIDLLTEVEDTEPLDGGGERILRLTPRPRLLFFRCHRLVLHVLRP